MPYRFKFENKKPEKNNVFTNEKDFQNKLELIKKIKPEDFKIIGEIQKLFEPSERQHILRYLIGLYNINLGGFEYKTITGQIILPKMLLSILNKNLNIIKENKIRQYGELIDENIFLGRGMLDVALENTESVEVFIKKPKSKKNKFTKTSNKNIKNKNE
jgi:hypothetical protein